MPRRRALAPLAALLLVLILVVPMACTNRTTVSNPGETMAPAPSQSPLAPGQRAELACGLSFVMPSGLPESAVEDYGPDDGHIVDAVWWGADATPKWRDVEVGSCVEDEDASMYIAYQQAGKVIARGDGGVEVWWVNDQPPAGYGGVMVLTHLRGKPVGVVQEEKRLATAAAAQREAVRLWQALSIEGAEVPPLLTY